MSSPVRLNDRAAIVGIGQLPFSKDIGRPIGDTAVDVVLRALEDAGLKPGSTKARTQAITIFLFYFTTRKGPTARASMPAQ